MKTPRLPALGLSALVAGASLLSGCGKSDDSSTSASSAPATNAAAASAPAAPTADASQNSGPGGRMRAMLDKLDLTDAQKQQIAQIRQTVTDRQQRREAIMNVLTPEQRDKLKELRAAAGTNAAPVTTSSGT